MYIENDTAVKETNKLLSMRLNMMSEDVKTLNADLSGKTTIISSL